MFWHFLKIFPLAIVRISDTFINIKSPLLQLFTQKDPFLRLACLCPFETCMLQFCRSLLLEAFSIKKLSLRANRSWREPSSKTVFAHVINFDIQCSHEHRRAHIHIIYKFISVQQLKAKGWCISRIYTEFSSSNNVTSISARLYFIYTCAVVGEKDRVQMRSIRKYFAAFRNVHEDSHNTEAMYLEILHSNWLVKFSIFYNETWIQLWEK